MPKTKAKAKKEPPTAATVSGSGSLDRTSSSTVNSTTKMSGNQGKSAVDEKVRTRVFAFILYADSAPADWRDILTQWHTEILVSPYHDQDVNPDGTPKKPHWHVMVMFPSVKTYVQAAEIRDSVNGVGWENVASSRGYARYLCHMDNPEKAQYDPEDVLELSGADYAETIRRVSDSIRIVATMQDFIADNNIMFYSDFADYCRENEPEWFEALVTRYTYTIYTYIKARCKKAELCDRMMVDPNTGEVKGG